MRKIVASAWITLDGVFDAESMGQWFLPFHTDARGKAITEWIMGCDAYVMGRTTYQMLAPHWAALKNNEMGIADKLNNVRKYVVSTTLKQAGWNNSTIIGSSVVEELTRMKAQPGADILIPGSATLVHSLADANLVDEYRFLVNPVIMGTGKRFFRDGLHATGLTLIKAELLGLGVMQLCYRSAKAS